MGQGERLHVAAVLLRAVGAIRQPVRRPKVHRLRAVEACAAQVQCTTDGRKPSAQLPATPWWQGRSTTHGQTTRALGPLATACEMSSTSTHLRVGLGAPVLKPEWKALGKVTTKEPSSWTRRCTGTPRAASCLGLTIVTCDTSMQQLLCNHASQGYGCQGGARRCKDGDTCSGSATARRAGAPVVRVRVDMHASPAGR